MRVLSSRELHQGSSDRYLWLWYSPKKIVLDDYTRRHTAGNWAAIKIVCGLSEGDSPEARRASQLPLIPSNRRMCNAWPKMQSHWRNWITVVGACDWTFNHWAAYSLLDFEIFYPQNILPVLLFLTQSQSEIVKSTNLKSCIASDSILLVCYVLAWRSMAGGITLYCL